MPNRLRPLRVPLRWIVVAAAILLGGAPNVAKACGPDSDCVVGERTYRIRMPPVLPAGGRVGAVFLAHGYRDTAENMMAYEELGAALQAMGLALIAPQSAGIVWSLPNTPSGAGRLRRDEVADTARLLDDVTTRFPIDRNRIMAAGMSAGGMLIWHLACYGGNLFAGYAPVSGTFWAPVPPNCPTGPVTILHTHGTDDPVVPLHGRAIGNGRQGDVMTAMRMYGAFGHFGPAVETHLPGLDCTRQTDPDGRVLELCLHPGGHELRTQDVVRAWRTLAEIKGW